MTHPGSFNASLYARRAGCGSDFALLGAFGRMYGAGPEEHRAA
ncbi:hypothetical protein [Streptomyces sp. SID12501]|nr:hypothetical protein [Streptomyces sp. SID12501]